jgi:hypothetical protein
MYFDGNDSFFDAGNRKIVTILTQSLVAPRTAAILAAAILAVLTATTSASAETYELSAVNKPGDLQRVTIRLEAKGELKLNSDGKKVTRTPLEVDGKLAYDERLLSSDPVARNWRSVRHYDVAEAAIHIGNGALNPRLNEDRRIVVAQMSGAKSVLYSPLGAITREELELIDVQGNSAVLSSLLPSKRTNIGESWTHTENTVGLLLGLEAVSQADLKSTLRSVDGTIALIEMSGSVSGAIGGVATDIEVQAKYNFDLTNKRITWLAMAIKENRSIGHAEPGLEITARLRIAIEPLANSARLDEVAAASIPPASSGGATLLTFDSTAGGFQLLHDRRWHIMIDRRDVTVLRFVDQGDLVAQCNISRLPDLPAGKQLQLEELQADVKQTLGQNFGHLIEASQANTDDGLRVLRVVAAGVVADLPIQWVYYHISNDRGQRAACVFTLEAKLVERFAAADQTLASGFQFLQSDIGPEPAPATQATSATNDARPAKQLDLRR